MHDDTYDGGRDFVRVAGLASIGAGIAAGTYAAAHLGLVVLEIAPDAGGAVSATALMIGSILTVVAFAGLYRHVLNGDAGFALLALLLGAVGGIGGLINGGYDLALATQPPPTGPEALAQLPNAMNPRGLLSHGVGGLGIIVAGLVIVRRALLARALAGWSYVTGSMMIATYLVQLLIIGPADPLVAIPAAATGLVALPTWLIWLGIELRNAGEPRL